MTFTVTVQGGTPKATAPWYNVTWTLPGTQSTDPVFDAAGSSVTGGVYTMVYDLTGIDPDKVSGTYSIAITDDNACPASVSPGGSSSAVVNTYATVDLYVDNINGSHSTGTGTSQRPLASITKAIAIASSGETINIMQNESGSTPAPQQYTEDTYGPVITKLLTFKRVAFTYTGGTYSGLTQLSLEPSFVANKAFVLATSDVTFDGFTPSALYVRSDGTIQEALDNISSTGVVTLLDGTWTLTSPLTISKGVTFQGLPPTNTASVACDLNPTAKLKAAGSTKLMLFSGSAAKTVSNLDLEIGNAGAINGRFFEIQTGSAGNVAASNIIFRHDHNNDGASPIRLYGITNTDYSAGALNDVAKFVGDVTDGAGFGTGKVNYGNQAPLPISSLENGWKAEDAGTATTATTVSQLYPMTGLTQIRAATSAQRPVWRAAGATGIGGRAAVEFNGTSRVLSTTATSGYIGGAAKSLFVVFKTPNGDVADTARQVIYKHGDALDGMSIVFLGTTGVGEESVVLSVYTSAGATQFVASETIGVSKNTVYIAQLYFNGGDATNRVGVALDNDAGNVAKKTWAEAAFNTATLTSPTAGVNHNISVGAKNGHVRWGTAAGETNTTAGLGLYFGTTDGGQVGEVLVYNTANKAQRDAIYCYLRNKYLTDTDKNSLEKGTPDGDVVAGGDVAFTNEIDVYPNPADADVTITVATAAAGLLRIELVDALGRVVQTLHDEYVSSNSVIQSVADARDLASGTYVIRVTGAGNLNMSKPFIIRR